MDPGCREHLRDRPPGTGKTHLVMRLAIRACQAGHRFQFSTAADLVLNHQKAKLNKPRSGTFS